jgi:hypothetical protein
MWRTGAGAIVKQNRIAFTGSRLTINDHVRTAFGYRCFREAIVTTSDVVKTGGTRHRHFPLTVKQSF